MSGAFSDSAFGKDTAFDSTAFEFGGAAPVVVVIDTHDGERKHRRHKEFKEARERLREQIRIAMDGPQADEILPELEKISAPAKPWKREPIEQRVRFEDLLEEVGLVAHIREAARQRFETLQRWDAEDSEDFEAMML